MVDRFTELCQKWHTPKVLIPGNKQSHDYAATYNRILEGREIKKVLEIGCGLPGLFHRDYVAGGSLFMWSEMFSEADIFGLDVNPETLVNEGKIRSFLCDQSVKDDLEGAAAAVGGGIDLIVDDGSHVPSDQVLTANVFVPLLSPTGVYVIEDVLPGGYVSQELLWMHETVELPRAVSEELVDDRLIVIEARNRRG